MGDILSTVIEAQGDGRRAVLADDYHIEYKGPLIGFRHRRRITASEVIEDRADIELQVDKETGSQGRVFSGVVTACLSRSVVIEGDGIKVLEDSSPDANPLVIIDKGPQPRDQGKGSRSRSPRAPCHFCKGVDFRQNIDSAYKGLRSISQTYEIITGREASASTFNDGNAEVLSTARGPFINKAPVLPTVTSHSKNSDHPRSPKTFTDVELPRLDLKEHNGLSEEQSETSLPINSDSLPANKSHSRHLLANPKATIGSLTPSKQKQKRDSFENRQTDAGANFEDSSKVGSDGHEDCSAQGPPPRLATEPFASDSASKLSLIKAKLKNISSRNKKKDQSRPLLGRTPAAKRALRAIRCNFQKVVKRAVEKLKLSSQQSSGNQELRLKTSPGFGRNGATNQASSATPDGEHSSQNSILRSDNPNNGPFACNEGVKGTKLTNAPSSINWIRLAEDYYQELKSTAFAQAAPSPAEHIHKELTGSSLKDNIVYTSAVLGRLTVAELEARQLSLKRSLRFKGIDFSNSRASTIMTSSIPFKYIPLFSLKNIKDTLLHHAKARPSGLSIESVISLIYDECTFFEATAPRVKETADSIDIAGISFHSLIGYCTLIRP